MIPWNKMPKDLQKAILAMIVCFGGASAGCRLFPVVCDPPPPPSVTPMICDPPPPPSATPSMTPMICDPAPPPSATPTLTPMICDPPPPPNSDASGGRPGDAAEPASARGSTLPLAEVRTVEIVWQEGFTFVAASLWDGAALTWTATGGSLFVRGNRATWQPPDRPGRHLLQVVADWGQRGLAVDAQVVVVEEDGSIYLC